MGAQGENLHSEFPWASTSIKWFPLISYCIVTSSYLLYLFTYLFILWDSVWICSSGDLKLAQDDLESRILLLLPPRYCNYVCICMYVRIHVCMHICVGQRCGLQVAFSLTTHNLSFWDRVPHWTWSSTFQQGWLAHKPSPQPQNPPVSISSTALHMCATVPCLVDYVETNSNLILVSYLSTESSFQSRIAL